MTMLARSADTFVEMFLRPVATGTYDWVAVTPGPIVQSDIVITDGNADRNSDPGVPNRCRFTLRNSNGDFTRKNPLGAYYGSIGLGVPTRVGVALVDDQFNNRTLSNTWGSVGNKAGDSWTNGTSSGGTVSATDWSVTGGTARHSVPAANAFRVSNLSATNRLMINAEARLSITIPSTTITGGSIGSEVWFRSIDENNHYRVTVSFRTTGTVALGIHERIAGVQRNLVAFADVAGLSHASIVNWDLRAQIEGGTLRAKVWATGTAEPVDWQVTGHGAIIRPGYTAVATEVFTGNTDTKPIVVQYNQVQIRVPMFAGEITDLSPSGNGNATPKVVDVECAGLLDRIQTGAALAESPIRRARSRPRRWLFLASPTVSSGSTSTATVLTSGLNTATVGDYLYLSNSTGLRKEDTLFSIVGTSVAGSNTTLTITPDARETPVSGDVVSIYRGLLQSQQPVAYWPCEDEDTATRIASGLIGGNPMNITGEPDFAAESGFPASKPIAKVKDSEWRALIPEYTTTETALSFNFLLSMPNTDEAATGTDLIQFYLTGTGWSYDLRYTGNGNGSFQLLVFNSALTMLFDSGQIDFGLRGNKQLVTLVLEETGGTVTYRLFTTDINGAVGGVGPNTISGVTTLGHVTDFRVNPAGGYDDVAFGHITIVPGVWDRNAVVFEFLAWANAHAMRQYHRLSFEDNIPFTYRDDWDLITTNLGAQKIDRIAGLMKEPAKSDGGLLHGMRGANMVEYITRGALTNQSPIVTITPSDCGEPELLADYTNITNRVSITRNSGSTTTVEQATGPLSTQDIPNGVGLREESYDLSLGGDDQLEDHANWRLGVGTIDQYRVPKIRLTSVGSSTISLETLLSIGVGDRVDIAGLSSMDVYDTLPQLVVGVNITLGNKFYPRVELNCVPYEVFRTLSITGDQYARPDGADTTTGSTLNTTQTGSLTLVSASGAYMWTTDATDFPLDVMISGERITLSIIVDTATIGTQTATISVRSVNGVVKSHVAGETVELAEPNYWQFR